ncbi:hypothetical protein V2O64_07380 [Verrucomicrobiaceae bacterium 227]
MKIHPKLLITALFVPLSCLAIESTFTEDNEGWVIIDHVSNLNPLPADGLNLTDEEPGVADGRLVVQDIENDWNWIVAPAKFHQSWADFSHLEMDLITDDSTTLFSLRFFIADGTNSAFFEFPLSGTPGGSVLNLSAPLVNSEWQISGDWEELIANVKAFYIRVDLNNNVASEADLVDRIALVDGTEPAGSTFPVDFSTELGSDYQIESSVDLVIWKNVGPPVPGDGSEISVEVLLTDSPRRFFRARKLVAP